MRRRRGGLALPLLSLLLAACTSAAPTLPPPSGLPGSPHVPTGLPGSAGSPGEPGMTAPPTGPAPTDQVPSQPPPAEPIGAASQIVAAMEAGLIDYPTSLLYRMYAVVGDPRLPAEFDGPTEGEDLAPFVVPDDPDLELPADIRALMDPYLVRPTDPLSAYSGELEPATGTGAPRAMAFLADPVLDPRDPLGPVALVACNERGWAAQNATVPIKVWARCTGNYEADIQAAVAIANAIYRPMTEYMRSPVLDLGTPYDGGDTSIDVYLTDDTSCPPEFGRCFRIKATAGGSARRTPPFGEPPGRPSSGWVLLRRSEMSDADEFRRTFIHELFHVLQYAHNSVIISRGTGATDTSGKEIHDTFWFVEASAAWAEYHFERKAGRTASARTVHRRFVNGFQGTDASLHSRVPPPRRYHAYIWPFFMVQEAKENVISDVWELLANETDWYGAMDAISIYVPFAAHFRDFAVRNINIDVTEDGTDPIPKRYKEFDPTIAFPDGKPFPVSMWQGPLAIEPTNEPVSYNDRIAPLSAHYWRFRVDDEVRKFEFDFSGLGDMEILDVDALMAIRQDGAGSAVTWEHRRLPEPKAKFCRSVPDEDVQEIYVVLTNHEREPIDLNGQFTVDASEEPCRGYEVTIVRETTGGPFDPTRLTLTAVLEPDEEGEDDGVLEAHGRGVGNYLHADMETGCNQFGYNGVILMTAQIVGQNLSVNAVALDPLILDFFSGAAPEKGGTTFLERAPLLAPGEPGEGIPPCDAYSKVTQSLTVRPLEPEP